MGCGVWGGDPIEVVVEEADLLGLDLGAGAFARGGEAVLLREDHLEREGEEVSPPVGGTSRAVSMEHSDGISLKVLSACQSILPF